MNKLNVYSIFASIDGEVNGYGQGARTVFVRLAGCNLSCKYPCDTPYALNKITGTLMTIPQVVKEIDKYGLSKVTITGGEPLIQQQALRLLISKLKSHSAKRPYYVSIETNGSIEWGYDLEFGIDADSFVVDYKLHSSGETDNMLPIEYFCNNLADTDFVKFVILNKGDFNQAIQIQSLIRTSAKFAYSPVYGKLKPQTLLKWMEEEKVNGILNLQLHKILNLKEDK